MNSVRQIRCSVCSEIGHNMTTCKHLRFRQEQMSRLYAHMWQKWVEMFARAALETENLEQCLLISRAIQLENIIWLKNPLHLRLLRSYLNISPAGSSEKELIVFISELYRYLVAKKCRSPSPLPRESINTVFDEYRWVLAAFGRNYGITVEQKIRLDNLLFDSCAICYEDYSAYSFVKTNCEHSFCHNCVIETIKILPENKKLSCAMCRSTVTHLSCYTSETNTNLKNTLNI